MSDFEEVMALGVRYATALDSKDWKTLREEVFLPDSTAAFGEIPPCADYEAIERTVREVLEQLDVSQHIMSNHVVEVGGDRGTHRCYLHAQHVRSGSGEGGDQFVVGGTYVDAVIRTDAGWRIKDRVLTVEWTSGNPDVLGLDD